MAGSANATTSKNKHLSNIAVKEIEILTNQLALEQNQIDYKARMASLGDGQSAERVSGFPAPELYN